MIVPVRFRIRQSKILFTLCYRAVCLCLESTFKKKNLPFSSHPNAKLLFILLNAKNRTFRHPMFQSWALVWFLGKVNQIDDHCRPELSFENTSVYDWYRQSKTTPNSSRVRELWLPRVEAGGQPEPALLLFPGRVADSLPVAPASCAVPVSARPNSSGCFVGWLRLGF